MTPTHNHSALRVLLTLLLLQVHVVNAEPEFSYNGFGTIGLAKISNNSISQNQSGSFITDDFRFAQDTKFGLQLGASLNDYFSATIQAVIRDREDYDPDLEWAYVTLAPKPNLKFRLGRLRLPLFYYSDTIEVGFSYPWIRPPSNVYEVGGVLSSYEGGEILYDHWFGGSQVSLQAYLGKSSDSTERPDGEEGSFKFEDIVGLVLMLERDFWGLRASYQQTDLSLRVPSINLLSNALNAAGFQTISSAINLDDIETTYISFGAFADYNDWLFRSEFINIDFDDRILPEQKLAYLTIGRHWQDFTLHYTYSRRYMNGKKGLSNPINAAADAIPVFPATIGAIAQLRALAGGVDILLDELEYNRQSHILGVNYGLTDSTVLKFEVEHVRDDDSKDHATIFGFSFDYIF